MRFTRVLRSVAVFEATKGLLVLMLGFGLFSLLHHDIRALTQQLLAHFHLNPEHRYSRIFLALANQLSDGKLWLWASFALLYTTVRFVEAYGLWHGRPWAEWFAALSGGIYIPFELRELWYSPNWISVVVLLINVLVVAFMLYGLRHQDEIAAEQIE